MDRDEGDGRSHGSILAAKQHTEVEKWSQTPPVRSSLIAQHIAHISSVPTPTEQSDLEADAGDLDINSMLDSLSSAVSSVSVDSVLDEQTDSRLPLDCPSELLTPRDESHGEEEDDGKGEDSNRVLASSASISSADM